MIRGSEARIGGSKARIGYFFLMRTFSDVFAREKMPSHTTFAATPGTKASKRKYFINFK